MAAIKMIAEPKAELDKWKKDVDDLTAQAGAFFKGDYDRLFAAGLPEEACKKVATETAGSWLDKELQIWVRRPWQWQRRERRCC